MQPPRLPKKKEVALQLLEQATVFVHLDPRAEAVKVPPWFKRQPQLVLQVGLNMAVPIPDLQVDDEGLSCTLSFNRSPFLCVIPWASVFALVGENRQGMIWPDDVPPEVQAQAAAQQAKQVPAKPELRIAPAPAEEPAPVASLPSAKKGRAASKGAKPAAKTAASKNEKTTRAASESAKTAKPQAAGKSATPARTAAAKAVVAKGAATKTATSKATSKLAAAKPVAAKPAAAKSVVAKPAAVKGHAPAARPAAAKEHAPAVNPAAPARPAAAAKPAPVAAPALKAPVQRAVPAAAQPAAAAGGASKRKLPPYLRIVK